MTDARPSRLAPSSHQHILFKDRELCWKYGSRVNYNLDLRVVDGAFFGSNCPPFFG